MAGVTPQRTAVPAPACPADGGAGNGAAANPPVGGPVLTHRPGLRPLPIVWQRLVKGGQTCDRCGSTQQELLAALAQVEPALQALGLQPVLQALALDEAAFRAEPSASNRLWIGGRSLEDWLGARSGASPCCSVCGDLPCRTVELDGRTFDTVPRQLIVRAILIAAAGMVEPSRSAAGPVRCCAGGSAGGSAGEGAGEGTGEGASAAVSEGAIERGNDGASESASEGTTQGTTQAPRQGASISGCEGGKSCC